MIKCISITLVSVKLFARVRELAGSDVVHIPFVAKMSVAELRRAIGGQVPAIAEMLSRCAIAINSEYANDEQVVDVNDEVAIIPPVSGGSAIQL